LRSTLADQQAVVTAHGLHDISGKLVARDPDALVADNACQRDNGDARGTASDVDDHIAGRLFDVYADTEGRGHRLVDHEHFPGARSIAAVAYCALFHLSNGGRNADHHAPGWREERLFREHQLDHLADHAFGGIEVGDHAVLQRTNGLQILVGLFVHHHRLLAHGHDLVG